MNSLMTTLQQPLSMAAVAHCLGLVARPARPAALRRNRSLRDGPRRAVAAALDRLPEAQADDETAAGCGWYDSSHELHQGLVVLEHSGVDRLATELPVTVWLQLAVEGTA